MIKTQTIMYLEDLSDIPCNKEKTKDKPTDQSVVVEILRAYEHEHSNVRATSWLLAMILKIA